MATKTLKIVANDHAIADVVTVSALDEQIREVNGRIDNVSELASAVSLDLVHTREFIELMNQHCMEEVYKNRDLIKDYDEDARRLLSDINSVEFKMHKARKWAIGLGIAALLYVVTSISAIIYLLCQVL